MDKLLLSMGLESLNMGDDGVEIKDGKYSTFILE